MTRLAMVPVLAAGLALMGCRGQPAGRPAVHIMEPAGGAVVTGDSVRVVLHAEGVEIAPAAGLRRGTAHHHLFLDRDVTPLADTIPAGVTGIIHLGRGQTEFVFASLAAGSHRIIAVLADPWHVPLPGAATDTVTVTVQGP